MPDDKTNNTGQNQPPAGTSPAATPPAAPATKTITVDGKTKELTEEEQLKYMQLGFSSTQRYEDAKRAKEEVAPLIRVREIFQKKKDGADLTDAELTEVANAFGLDTAEFMTAAKTGENDPIVSTTSPSKITAPSTTIDRSKLNERDRKALEFAEIQMYEKEVTKVKNFCKEKVDKDPIFSKMVNGIDDESQKNGVLQEIADYVFKDVQLKALLGMPYGTDLVESTIQEARNHFQRVGILYKAAEQPAMNLGAGLGSLGSAAMAELAKSGPVKRMPSTEPAYEETAGRRFLQSVFGKSSK